MGPSPPASAVWSTAPSRRLLQHCRPEPGPGVLQLPGHGLRLQLPLRCSYCFLQDYLGNNPALKAFTNPGDALAEIDAVLRAHPERDFRIGTGELADSLALDPITGLSGELVPFFAGHRNATLELKTKSDCVDDLLHLDPRGRVVVSWSVNATAICAEDEAGTASLGERLAAARRVQAAGIASAFTSIR